MSGPAPGHGQGQGQVQGPAPAPRPTSLSGTRTALDDRLGRLARLVAPLIAGFVAFGVTRSTMLPGIDFWDTAEFQTVAAVFGTAHPTGYPTYTILGWLASLALAPVGEPAARLNVLSGLLLAVACGLTVWVVRMVGQRTLPALAAGVLLALTPWPWRVGSFADPHMLHLVFVAAILLALVGWEMRRTAADPRADRWLVGASVLYGLSLGNHHLTLLLAPGIALFLLAVDPGILRDGPLLRRCALALFGTAGLVYLQLPIRALTGAPLVYGHPENPLGFLYVAMGVQFAGDVGGPLADLPGKVGRLISDTAAQFGVTAAVLPAAFVATAVRRPRIAILTAAWFLVTWFFAASYDNAMIERYYLGPILCAVVWLGSGAAIVVDAALILRAIPSTDEMSASTEPDGPAGGEPGAGAGRHGLDWFPIRLAFITAALLVTPAIWNAPGTFPLVDRRAETAASDWGSWAFTAMEPNAVVVSWWSFSTPLWYRQLVLGERPDIRIVDDRDREDEELGSVDDVIRVNHRSRPVYLIRDEVEIPEISVRWILDLVEDPTGQQSLYRVRGPTDAGAQPPARDPLHTPVTADTVHP